MFIGDGAKLVRDAFDLAKEKAPAIIFIGWSVSLICPRRRSIVPMLVFARLGKGAMYRLTSTRFILLSWVR